MRLSSKRLGIPLPFFFASNRFSFKFTDIDEALYECPWYELSPEERKQFLPIMIAIRDIPVLKALGIQEFTYEFYKDTINSAYSTALVLEEFIEKF